MEGVGFEVYVKMLTKKRACQKGEKVCTENTKPGWLEQNVP